MQNGKIGYIHHLKDQVLKFKKNSTLGKKSEKLMGLRFFYFFPMVLFSDLAPYFHYFLEICSIIKFLSDFKTDGTKLFIRSIGSQVWGGSIPAEFFKINLLWEAPPPNLVNEEKMWTLMCFSNGLPNNLVPFVLKLEKI